jgi:hypothetical protein
MTWNGFGINRLVKNIKTLIFLLLVTTGFAQAQILIGPTGGFQTSWVTFDDKDYKDLYQVKPVLGFHAGVNLSFKVRKRFFLHSSLIYSQKGKIIEGKKDKLLYNEVRYNYVELPVLYTVEFKGYAGKGKEFKWYLGGGPLVSYWLGGKGKIYESGINENAISEKPIPYKIVFNEEDHLLPIDKMNVHDPNRLQLGINISAGIVFEPFGYQKIMLTGRYELGHSFLSKTGFGYFTATDDYDDVLQVRNNGFRISVAYLIDLKLEQRKKGKSTIKKNKL